MADEKGAYGTVHVMEEEMREAGDGVFEAKSGQNRKAAKPPANKMEVAPANKGIIGAAAFDGDGDGRVGGSRKGARKAGK